MRMTRFAVTPFAAAAIAAASPQASAQVPNPETFTLDNGLDVVVITDGTVPVVSHSLWYRVGAADEPPGQSGIAHYLEHLMFLGTTEFPPNAVHELIQINGGVTNAFTSWDYTGYFANIAVEHLELVMELEADRMVNLVFDPDLVDNERAVIIEERRQRIDNNPSAQLSEQIFAALYRNHPYGVPIIGWEHEMHGLTWADAEAFYETWYAPNNAILILVGDVDAESVRPLVEAHYGDIPSRPVPERIRVQEPPQIAARSVTVESETVRQREWRRFYMAPSYASPNGDLAYALSIFSEVFGSGTSSRLYRSLVIDQELTSGAGSGYSPSNYDQTVFALFLDLKPDIPIEDVEAALQREIDRFLTEGPTEAEVEAAKDRLITAAAFARDGLTRVFRTVGVALTSGQTIEELEDWPNRIAAVTAEDVLTAARLVMRPEGSVTGHLLPAETQALLDN